MHIDSMLHAVDKQALVKDTHDQCPRLVFVHIACVMAPRPISRRLVALLYITLTRQRDRTDNAQCDATADKRFHPSFVR